VIELCGRCNHANDHVAKQCRHEAHNGEGGTCACPDGVRADVFACQQLSILIGLVGKLNDTMLKVQVLMQLATKSEVQIDYQPNGDATIRIAPFGAMSQGIIVPGH
jgi:hypothetical protein